MLNQPGGLMNRIVTKALVLAGIALLLGISQVQAQQKPNVLIIWATTSATGTSAPTTRG